MIIIGLFLDCAGIAQQAKDYDEAIMIGDELFLDKKIIEAKKYYQIALSFKSHDKYANSQIKKVSDVLSSRAYKEEAYLAIIEIADDLFRKYKFDYALREYNKALVIIPNDGYAKGKVNRILEIKESQNGDTEDFNNLMSTGVILLDQNKFTEAIKSFKKAAKILPDNTAPDVQIAKSKEARINMEAKLTAYSEEIELASNYIDTKEYAKTLRHLKNAQDILPDNWALANEIKTFTLLATKQNPPNQIDRIENKQVITQFSETDNKSLISRKPTEILPVITKSRASMINYKPSLTLVSDNSSQNNYQSEIDIMIEQNQKEIKVIEDTLKKLKEIDEKYAENIVIAQNLFNKDQFHEARISFLSASQIKPLEAKPKQFIAIIDSIFKILEVQKQIDQQFNSYIIIGDSLLKQNLYDKSITAFTEAVSIKPSDTLASNKLQIAKNKKIDYDRAIQVMKDYNKVVKEADELLAEEEYLISKITYEKALKIKTDEAYPIVKINEISEIFAKIEFENNQKYNKVVTVADNFYSSSNLVEALVQYKIALDMKADESYPQDRIAEINTLIEDELKKTKDKYDLAISNADKLYAVKIYDKAIDAYREALNILNKESYPKEMISKIITLMTENAIVNILNDTITINSETTRKFAFNPVSIKVRRSSYIYFKATNLSGNVHKLIVSYGSDKGKNGGFVVVVAEGVEKNDYIIRVGNQYKWFADDNNWISIYPEKGDIQLSMMQISKSN